MNKSSSGVTVQIKEQNIYHYCLKLTHEVRMHAHTHMYLRTYYLITLFTFKSKRILDINFTHLCDFS